MRVKIAGPVKVRKGQLVHLHASLRPSMRYASVDVFTAVGYAEPSPHVPHSKLDISGKPQMLSPSYMRLSKLTPGKQIEIVADEDCKFWLFQDIDILGDPLAKGRIKRHGRYHTITRAVQALRRLFRNTRR